MCASLPVARAGVLVGVPVFVRARLCVCVRIWIPGKEGREVQPNGALRATSASTLYRALGGGTEGTDDPCSWQ